MPSSLRLSQLQVKHPAMTTLDPSHFPWKARDGDPTTGGAVHTSVRAPFASTSNGARYASSSDDVTSSEDEREDIDADDHAEHFARLRRHRHARKDKKRRDHEDARAHGRIPTIPVPDVRFEQSYLMSIQRASLRPPSTSQADLRSSSHSAFIHSQPIQSSAHTEDDHSNDTTMTPSKLRKDKRRRVEESLALVDDPASRKGSPLDDLLHPSSDRLVSIQWSQIAYITVRDQVFSPLVQGALWALGGIFLSSAYAGYKARFPSPVKDKSSASGLRAYLARLVGPTLAGVRSGPRQA